MAEKSMFTVFGPLRLSCPQFPNVPGTGFEKAAALNQPYPPLALGFRRTGFRQLSRSPLGEN